MAGKIFITGSTGDIGSQMRTQLAASEHPIRLLLRREAQVYEAQHAGHDAVLGSLDQSAAELASYMQGCTTLFLLTAANPNQLQQSYNAIDAAFATRSITWIIRVSAGDKRENTAVPWAKAHAQADAYLAQRCKGRPDVAYTILSPSAFYQNLITSAPAIQRGFLPQAAGDGPAGWIDTADVAAVACKLLLSEEEGGGPKAHAGKEYILTGPQSLNFYDMARIFSAQCGHRVRYLDLPAPAFRGILRLAGLDAWLADGLVAQFTEIVRRHDEGIEVPSPDVEIILRRPPKAFEQFVCENVEMFRGRDVLPFMQLAAVGLVASSLWLLVAR